MILSTIDGVLNIGLLLAAVILLAIGGYRNG